MSSKWIPGLLFLAFVWAPISAPCYTIALSQAKLQVMVEKQFPKTYDAMSAQVQLHSPRVVLTNGSPRLGMHLGLQMDVGGQYTVNGSALVDGEPEYDSRRREFHLRDPRVRDVVAEGLPAPYAEMASAAVAELVRQQFPVIVIYRIDQTMLDSSLSLRMLKSVRTEKGSLVLELGW